MTPRVRCRNAGTEMTAVYVVVTQQAKGRPWVRQGLVARYGNGTGATWAGLGDEADAWTDYQATRAGAVAEMLAATRSGPALLSGSTQAAAEPEAG